MGRKSVGFIGARGAARGRLRGRLAALLLAGVVPEWLAATPAHAAPDFVGKPSDVYDDFEALKEPRADLPVGALWIQGYGPHGEGAPSDNLVTTRSLSGVSLTGELQLRLTLGIASFLNLDPGYGSRISARFSDLFIVRVKDVSKLPGPQGEARILEGLRAGTITISTDSDLGLDFGGRLDAAQLPVVGRTDAGRKRSFTIDGRDLFIAFRVATSVPSRGDQREGVLKRGGKPILLELGDYRLRLEWSGGADAPGGGGQAGCGLDVALVLGRRSDEQNGGVPAVKHDFAAPGRAIVELPLAVPVADGRGGLLTRLVVRRIDDAAAGEPREGAPSCRAAAVRLAARLEGSRLKQGPSPSAPGW